MQRLTAWVAASLSALLIAVLAPSVLVAAPASADPLATKRAEAGRIAAQLERLAERASVLTEDYNEARYKSADLEARTKAAGAELSKVEARATAARTAMRQISVHAYVHGGLAPTRSVSEFTDLGRAQFFMRAAANRQKDAIDALKQSRAVLAEKQASLAAARANADKVLAQVNAKRQAAAAAVKAEQTLLASVKGDLARLLSAEQARRNAAAAAAARRAPATAPRAARSAKPVTAPPPGADAPAPNSAAGAAIAEAKRQVGKPYQWGGSGPGSFDCSGLTSWAWRVGGGRSLPHSSRAQYSATSRVPVDQIAPGDLVFFGGSVAGIHHVGLYIGGGQMVDAPQSGRNVQYAHAFRKDLVGVGRVN